MRTVLALASFAGLVAAQTGYGRFACTLVNGDGTFSADQSLCADAALIPPGTNDPAAETQGDLPAPTGSQCVIETESGAYFCGIAGASCASDANCDNGPCVAGICQGGFTQNCGELDSNCAGFLYCLSSDFTPTPSRTCGAVGAFCQDPTVGSVDFTPAENQLLYNQFCSTGYCNAGTANCDVRALLGEDCSTDPTFRCADGLTCDPTSFLCIAAPVPSGGARQRRNHEFGKRSLCPAAHTACKVSGRASGFECVDVMSSLEQCGGCASSGGVDCTALPGVASVGCVAGTCEIWACAEGYKWDTTTQSCVA
ncbi:hypothetical protein JCM11251_003615 [Rhodosporidiobolus azoricus]